MTPRATPSKKSTSPRALELHGRRKTARYGWKPDLPDQRDLLAFERVTKLPTSIDMRGSPAMPGVYDQGQYGSCTGNACAGLFAYELFQENKILLAPARFFIYAEERLMEGSALTDDSGAMIRDGMKVLSKFGAPPESKWPYTAKDFSRAPTPAILAEAQKHKVMTYRRVNNKAPHAALQILAAGHPIVFGFSVYESFESDAVAASGDVPLPAPGEQMIGGHAVMAVGYDQNQSHLIVRNSWGKSWGDKGYFTMPFSYAFNTDLSDDWWMASVCK